VNVAELRRQARCSASCSPFAKPAHVTSWACELRAASDDAAADATLSRAEATRADPGVRRADRPCSRLQRLGGAQGDGGASRPDRLQPVLPGTGEDRQRRSDHVAGIGDSGRIRACDECSGRRLSRNTVHDADPRIRRHARAVTAAGREGRYRQCGAARYGRAVVAEPAVRFRSNDLAAAPALLVPAALAWLDARPVRKVEGAALHTRRPRRDVCRCRGNRRGEARAHGDRRLLARSREVRPPRRPHSARCPAQRSAGHGQDVARARRCRRSRGSVLLDVRLRVRRGHRGGRCVARQGPFQAGEGGGAGDRVHRRARRDRPLAKREWILRRRRVR